MTSRATTRIERIARAIAKARQGKDEFWINFRTTAIAAENEIKAIEAECLNPDVLSLLSTKH